MDASSKLMRIGLALICGTSFLATPAIAKETLSCTFTDFDGPPGAGGHATVEIDGEDLFWKLDPVTLPTLKVPSTSFHYRILQNNDVGVVAANAQAENLKGTGQRIAASIIIITRANMNIRMGSVGIYGAHDALTGPCEEETSAGESPDNKN